MSYPPQPSPPQGPAEPIPPAAQPTWPQPPTPIPAAALLPPQVKKPRGRVLLPIATGMVGLLIGLVAGLAGGGSSDNTPAPAASSPQGAASAPVVEPTTESPTDVLHPAPKPADFKLAVKVLKKECFGSAGCNLTFRVELAIAGNTPDPNKTYELTYQVRGGDEPFINTLTVSGGSYETEQEENISTKRSSDKLTAVVTAVSEL